ncbi:nucleoside hydrolase, partial [Candidatus Bathyarchaeota archaeon]|nr:nucleoside hydrolase [Candidatus Bathyarchaeota archaeon]
MKNIILDTDPGVDDALAILLALNSPEIKLEAVTTVAGNVNHSKGHLNAKKLLEFMGEKDIPVCRGAENPLIGEISHAEEFHGKTGLGNAVLPEPSMRTHPLNAVEMILNKADDLGKKLTLVAIGPQTNIASAILADPSLPKKVGGLVIMGGAFNLTPYGFGNANPVAEFNIWHDPEAAKIVFNSGIELTCAGLDTTTHPEYRMSKGMFEEIKAH